MVISPFLNLSNKALIDLLSSFLIARLRYSNEPKSNPNICSIKLSLISSVWLLNILASSVIFSGERVTFSFDKKRIIDLAALICL